MVFNFFSISQCYTDTTAVKFERYILAVCLKTQLSMRKVLSCAVLFLWVYLSIMTWTNWNSPKYTEPLYRHHNVDRNPQLPPTTSMDEHDKAQPDLQLTNGYSLLLVVRTTTSPKLLQLLFCSLMRSAALFWSPKLGPISLILDAESKQDQDFAVRLRQQENSLMGLKFNIMFEPLPSNTAILDQQATGKHPSYTRQLWSFFVMDLYINSSIIALTDTDAVFYAPVTPENIFNGSKLRAMGQYWKSPEICRVWDTSTRIAIGKPMVANFMTYFPTFIWRSTITNCRNYILKHMNVSTFEEAFPKMFQHRRRGRRSVIVFPSPVCIVMSYAFYFEHDLYDWHIDVNNNLQGYNKRHMPPDFEIKPNDTLPYIDLTSHLPYVKKPKSLKDVYCEAKRHVDTLPEFCANNTLSLHLFEFQTGTSHLNTWCKGPDGRIQCNQLIQTHYQNFVKYYQSGMYDLDVKRVFAVERAASEFNISCPKLFD